MDYALIRTFMEVAATGSFVRAAERLFVTQSAVSLRVQRLEDKLGRPLFTRSKAGAELTPAGHAFERYALSLLKVWEEAKQQIAIPEGFTESLTIGSQYSLWPRMGFRWIDQLRLKRPSLSLRAELGMPDRLTRYMIEGVVQACLTYTPQLRPGLSAQKALDEQLLLVAAWPEPELDQIGERYAFVDWGPEFVQAHALHLPDLIHNGLTLSLGALSAEFVRRRDMAAYLPARYVRQMVDAGELHLVPDAPVFPYPVWAVWRDDLDEDLRAVAETCLSAVIEDAQRSQDAMHAWLDDISEDEIDLLNPSGGIHDDNSF